MKLTTIFVFVLVCNLTLAQPNCFIYPENSNERKACELSYRAIEFPQGSKASQKLFDEAISAGPNFAWAYYEKSVPYFKRGFLNKGLQILNKAVDLDPKEFICYRAYWYWQYKNFALCIKDLELYYNLPKVYPQLTPGGDKDMRIILGLCYWKEGNIEKGIATIKNCIANYDTSDDIGLTDYQALGMLYILNEEYNYGLESLDKQLEINSDVADTYFFKGIAFLYQSEKEKARIEFNKALAKLKEPNRFRATNSGYVVEEAEILSYLNQLN